MNWLISFIWTFFIYITNASLQPEYSSNLQVDLDYVVSLENHHRSRRQIDSSANVSTTTNWQNSTTLPPTATRFLNSNESITTQSNQNASTSSSSSTSSSTSSPEQTSAATTPSHTPTELTTTSTGTTASTSQKSSSITHSTPDQTTQTTTVPLTYIKQFDDHSYYNKTVLHDISGFYWDELVNHTKHTVLSNDGYLDSAGVDLPFTMPFYGHNITKVQLTTGGFLYMSPWVHRFLTFSQYTAPLMANFDTKSPDSEILYKFYNNSVVFEWRNVNLNDQGHHGQFTFQTKLFQNGTIMFVYKKMPVSVSEISSDDHPVKIGLSDAFYTDFTQNGVRYRRINSYHRVEVDIDLITENTVVIFHPQPTCNLATTCDLCVNPERKFDCSWCPTVWRCSDGLDWYRQEWLTTGCVTSAGNTTEICKVTTTTTTTTTPKPTTTTPKPTTTLKPTTTTLKPTTTTPSPTTESTTLPTTGSTTRQQSPSTEANSTPTTSSTKFPTTPKTATTPSPTATTSSSTTTTTPATTTPTPSTTQKPTTTTTRKTTTTTTTTLRTRTTMTTLSASTTTLSSPVVQAQTQNDKGKTNSAAIAVPIVLVLFIIIVLIGGWIYYAYTHPETGSGQWLIEHRPSLLRQRLSNLFKWDMQTGEKYLVKNDDIDISMQESSA